MPNVTRRNRGMNVLACFAMRDQKRCDLRETACRWLYATHSRTRNSAHFPLMGSFGKAIYGDVGKGAMLQDRRDMRRGRMVTNAQRPERDAP